MKKDDMPKNSSSNVVGAVDELSEFTGETDTETNPSVMVVVVAVGFNEAQKTASSEKSAFSNTAKADWIYIILLFYNCQRYTAKTDSVARVYITLPRLFD
ncbi:Uncharacterized protein FWK35_00034364, partial [Aphis craccivora]